MALCGCRGFWHRFDGEFAKAYDDMNSEAEQNRREQWVDQWRGLLILLVVLGHAVGGAEHFAAVQYAGPLDYVYLFIYCFHMAAFFVLCGMTWSSRRIGFGDFVLKKAFRLIVPYFIWGIFSVCLYVVLSQAFAHATADLTSTRYTGVNALSFPIRILALAHAGGWPGGHGFEVNSVLWFLPCMFTVCMLYYCVDHLIPQKVRQIVLACLLAPVPVLLLHFHIGQGWPWGLRRAFEFLPFVILGRWFFPKSGFSFYKNAPGKRWSLILLGWLVYAALVLMRPHSDNLVIGIVLHVFAMLRTALVVFLSAWTIQASPGCWRSWLICFGTSSLGIMLFHKWFVMAGEMKVVWIRNLFAQNFWLAMTGVLVVTSGAAIAALMMTKVVRRIFPWALGERRR